jgi:hypothetical protein
MDNNNIIWRYCISWGQSFTHLLVHAIFSTKDRRPFLRSEIREIFKRHRVAFDERYVWD